MTSAPFELSDPRFEKREYGAINRFFLKFIRDERDLPFMHLILVATFTLVPATVYLFWPGNYRWWLGALYLVFNLALLFGRFILMLHNTSHRSLFKRQYRLLNYYIPWVLGPFFGETPDTYYVHHVTMHHAENNLDGDLSGTMRFQRDNPFHFFRYWFRFFTIGLVELAAYQWKRRRVNFIQRMVAGELGFYVLVVVLAFVNLPATFTVFIFPFLFARFIMMAGNWGQHAFIDRTDPGNSMKNSITCINTPYNKQRDLHYELYKTNTLPIDSFCHGFLLSHGSISHLIIFKCRKPLISHKVELVNNIITCHILIHLSLRGKF